ncbi:MAG TPA: hypothetical protein VN446_02850 [Candidatus Acidoferrum sp.]|nr:hypothetical protein [Candidatus Acidoferrum sp.]
MPNTLAVTAGIITAIYLFLAAVDLRAAFKRASAALKWFFVVCYAASYLVLILHSRGVVLYGPSQLVLEAARALGLVK